jgi:hypothetical protein
MPTWKRGSDMKTQDSWEYSERYIRDLFDRNPNLTIRQLAKLVNLSESETKSILMGGK